MDFTEEDLRGRRIAHYMWAELEKIAQGVGGEMTEMSDQQAGELQGTVQREVEGSEEASPAHGVVASRVEQLDDKKARGIPVIQAPPGYVYAPELQAFIPDQNNPGWVSAEQAAEAAKAQSFYQQGQQDLVQQQAQAEAEQQAAAQVQQAQQQQAQQQAAAQQQQYADALSQQQLEREYAKQQAQGAVQGLQSPEGVTGRPEGGNQEQQRQRPSGGGKGVTIRIGK
ncbi:MAG: hypothetical protein GWN58_44450 [Anaerolineae bacterium]|nr:hypothetical protein [Anaerolineae bacterium]